MKPILDAACGSKMFWFDKNNPNVEALRKAREAIAAHVGYCRCLDKALAEIEAIGGKEDEK